MQKTKNNPNHLISEKSPYLFQHAYNPVNWYPWGEEAFSKAKAEDKPVFLSVGYSTCHWCHVMAHESFEDEEAAEVLNRDFIAVKVDREERPDIDAVYMDVCQALTGSGGWPMTIIMTPDKKPFFAGTYLPKNSRYGMTGLVDLLFEISRRWSEDRKALIDNSEQITTYMQAQKYTKVGGGKPLRELISSAKERFAHSFDKKWGGFGAAPKFPMPHNLIFLLRYSVFEHDKDAKNCAESTLEHMFRGGIFDHIGGGFSRYSTDEKWLIPHFEKMLYDNALLTWAFVEAYGITNRTLYRNIAVRTMNYVLTELWDPMGGFLCGQDADSDGVEGKFYAFTPTEITDVLGEADGSEFCRRFGINEHGAFDGKSIPNLINCDDFDSEDGIASELATQLYAYRLQRTTLHKDDKVLTSWNALMIIALAKAARVFKGAKYLVAAKGAQKFIADNLTDGKGHLFIRWKDGEAANLGQLEDYAFYGLALLELYEATFDTAYITEAIRIAEKMKELFWDYDDGGFYLYSKEAEQLITRPKPLYDGALPSGNSAAAILLTKLSKITGEEKWKKACDEQLDFISTAASAQPTAYSFSMLALMEAFYPSAELLCVTAESNAPTEFTEFVQQKIAENLTVMLKTPENQNELATIAPYTAEYPIPESGSIYYLCRDRACLAPARNLSELQAELEKA